MFLYNWRTYIRIRKHPYTHTYTDAHMSIPPHRERASKNEINIYKQLETQRPSNTNTLTHAHKERIIPH